MTPTPDREEALRLARLDVEQEYGSPASRRNARLALALAADLEAAERERDENTQAAADRSSEAMSPDKGKVS